MTIGSWFVYQRVQTWLKWILYCILMHSVSYVLVKTEAIWWLTPLWNKSKPLLNTQPSGAGRRILPHNMHACKAAPDWNERASLPSFGSSAVSLTSSRAHQHFSFSVGRNLSAVNVMLLSHLFKIISLIHMGREGKCPGRPRSLESTHLSS